MKRIRPILALFFALAASLTAAQPERPNIIVILADDAGFADFGAFGGVADTPEIDRLATEGMRFTQAFSNARCMPTRLSLLTGLPPQLADYKLFNEIKENSVTLAEVLGESGYATYMVGKWHIGLGGSSTEPEPIPTERGFDRFYGIWEGAAWPRKQSLTEPERGDGKVRIIEDGVELPWEEVPEDYYVTFTWNDKAIEMIESTPEDQPFFLYLAHTAPHWPIQPFQSYIDAYDGRFDAGWEAVRAEIFQNQQDLGLFPPTQTLAPLFPAVTPFAEADSNLIDSYTSSSEKYYAAVTEMDDSVGWLMDALEAEGRADNTLVIFLSDNGADEVIGGFERGMVSNTPFFGHKLSYYEGGIATPMIAWWPGKVPANTIQKKHEIRLEDFMATFLDITGAAYPKTYNGNKIFPHQGRSFLPALLDPDYDGGPRFWFWEHDAQRGVWNEPWKAVFNDRRHPVAEKNYTEAQNGWLLYNLADDRAEAAPLAEFTDLSQPGDNPTPEERRLLDMIQAWKDWAVSVGWEPTGRTADDNLLDEGFRGTDGTTERASPGTYERFFPLPGDQANSGLIQVFGLDRPVGGLRRLAFEAVSPTSAPMSVTVYGANAFPEIPAGAADNPLDMPDESDIPSLGTPVATFDFGGALFDWSAFATPVDLGTATYTHLTLVFQLGDLNQQVDATRLLAPAYSDWAQLQFGPAELEDPLISGPNAIAPVGDTSNFLKYLFGRDADEPGQSPQSVRFVEGELEVGFDVIPGVLERNNFVWDLSTDLVDWSPVSPRWFGLGAAERPDRERLLTRIPTPPGDRAFVRATGISTDGGDGGGGDTGSRMEINDGRFDNPLIGGQGWALSDDHLNVGWVAHGAGSRWNHDAVSGNVFADGSGAANLVQIVSDNNLTQGSVTLRFDAINTEGDTLQVFVYGVTEDFRLNLFDTGGPKLRNDTSTDAVHTVLVNGQNFNTTASSFTPREVSFEIPSGGFLSYAIMFRSGGVSATADQRIDNVRLE